MNTHQQPAAILALFLLPLLAGAAPRKPAFTLELLAPAAGVLGGQVDVRVGVSSAADEAVPAPVPSAVPSAVYCSLGGSPAVAMTRDGDSGAWVATLDTTMVPNGAARLEVVTNDKRSRLAADFTVDNPLRHYFVKVTQADGDMLWSAPVWLAVVSWK